MIRDTNGQGLQEQAEGEKQRMMGYETWTYGDPSADTLLLQMVDDHDLGFLDREAVLISDLSAGQSFYMKAVKVKSWNRDLSPWRAPAAFGDEDFGEGAQETLQFLLAHTIPEMLAECEETGNEGKLPDFENDPAGTLVMAAAADRQKKAAGKRIFLGGYSLAGLFALWAGYQTDLFDGIAAVSPSIWFPGFTDYMQKNAMGAGAVYLSLGDREERTRHPLMSQVGKAIREGHAVLQAAGIPCTLEWNKGNHFKNPDLRTAKGFAWLLAREHMS